MPENTIKFALGAMLTTFGCFWSHPDCEPDARTKEPAAQPVKREASVAQ